MTSNVVNFPNSKRLYVAPDDERNPQVAAIEMFKRFLEFSRRENGDQWTWRVVQGSLDVADMNNWRERAAVWNKEPK
jgi:hypothetical protein